MGKFRLIEEVRKRPILWNSLLKHRSQHLTAEGWKEVASSLGGNVTPEACKNTWKILRGAYRAKILRQKRIELAKRQGTYDPKKNSDNNWVYYEHMHFLKKVCQHEDENLKTENEVSNRVLEKTNESTNNQEDPPPISSRSSTPESTLYEIHIIDDSDDNNSVKQHPEFLNINQICIKEEPVSEIESDLCPMNDEESNIKSSKRQRLMQNNLKPKQTHREDIESDEEKRIIRSRNLNRNESEDKTASQQNVQTINVDIKKEPAIDIEVNSYFLHEEKSIEPLAKRNLVENELKSLNQHSTPKQKHTEYTNLKTNGSLSIPLKNNNSQHSRSTVQCFGDADYKFLLSFSSHLKSLTVLQNLQFRAQMSDLILSFLTTSSSANELKISEINTEVLAIDISDPDCNFLISFLPFMKSLSPLQNLQYRAKLSHLIIDILSKI